MSERRALLDTDMYKISEEDSQDEEVLSSLSKVTLGNSNEAQIRPVNVLPSGPSKHGPSGSRRKPGSGLALPMSLNNGNLRKAQLEENRTGRRSSVGKDPAVEWPSSETGSDSDGTESSHSHTDSGSDTEGTRSGSSSSSEQTWKSGEHLRAGRDGSGSEDESYSSSSTCSSCVSVQDTGRQRTSPGRTRNLSTGSTHEESQALRRSSRRRSPISDDSYFITERELASLVNEYGSVSLVEYYIPSELLDVDDSSLSSASPHVPTLSRAQTMETPSCSEAGTCEIDNPPPPPSCSILKEPKSAEWQIKGSEGSRTGEADQAESLSPFQLMKHPNSHRDEKGMISRFLKRSRDVSGGGEAKTELDGKMTKDEGSSSDTKTRLKKEPKVFRFKDEDEGEIRYVQLDLTSWELKSNLLGRRARLIESMLGIIPDRFSAPSASVASPGSEATRSSPSLSKLEVDDDRIMVAGFVPDGPAARSRQIKIGEWLHSIDGKTVTSKNVDSYLAAVHQKNFDEADPFAPPYPSYPEMDPHPFFNAEALAGTETSIFRNSRKSSKPPFDPTLASVLARDQALGIGQTQAQPHRPRRFGSSSVAPIIVDESSSHEDFGATSPAPPPQKKVPFTFKRYGQSQTTLGSSPDHAYIDPLLGSFQLRCEISGNLNQPQLQDGNQSTALEKGISNTKASASDPGLHACRPVFSAKSSSSAAASFKEGTSVVSQSTDGRQYAGLPKFEALRNYSAGLPSEQPPSYSPDGSPAAAHPLADEPRPPFYKRLESWPKPSTLQRYEDSRPDVKITVGVKKVASSFIPEPETSPSVGLEPKVEPKDSMAALVEDGAEVESRQNKTELPPELLSQLAIVFISNRPDDSTDTQPGSSSSPEQKKSVVFSWPQKKRRGEKTRGERLTRKIVRALSTSHGMFSTLYGIMPDVTGSRPVHAHILIDDELIHVSFWSDNEGESLLLFAISLGTKQAAKRKSVCGIMDRVRGMLSFLYGTLDSAFGSDMEEGDLDRFMSNTLASLIDTPAQDFLFTASPSAALQLSPNTRRYLDESMFDFESGLHLDAEQETQSKENEPTLRRVSEDQFDCLGSCIFYKGKVLLSHVKPSILDKLYSYLLTEMNAWDGRDWKCFQRLFLWRLSYLSDGDLSSSCYTAVVGTQYFTCAFLLKPVNNVTKIRDVPLKWIRRGYDLVNQLMIRNVESEINLKNDLFRLLHGQPEPQVVDADKASKKSSKKKHKRLRSIFKIPTIFKKGMGRMSKSKVNPSVVMMKTVMEVDPGIVAAIKGSSKKKKKRYIIPPIYQRFVTKIVEPASEGGPNKGEQSSDGNPTNTATSSEASSLKLSGSLSTGSQPSSSNAGKEKTKYPIMVVKGNVLLSLIHLDYGNGYFVSVKGTTDPAFEPIVAQFRRCASLTHQILAKASKARVALAAESGSLDRKWVSRSLAPICEHGLLFECEIQESVPNKKKLKTRILNYWVVGRLYDDSRETYLCYEDGNVSQNVVESAFKISQSAAEF